MRIAHRAALAAIIFVLRSALLPVTAAASPADCLHRPQLSAGGYWRYHVRGGEHCWYRSSAGHAAHAERHVHRWPSSDRPAAAEVPSTTPQSQSLSRSIDDRRPPADPPPAIQAYVAQVLGDPGPQADVPAATNDDPGTTVAEVPKVTCPVVVRDPIPVQRTAADPAPVVRAAAIAGVLCFAGGILTMLLVGLVLEWWRARRSRRYFAEMRQPNPTPRPQSLTVRVARKDRPIPADQMPVQLGGSR
jgi:hypothetical protein